MEATEAKQEETQPAPEVCPKCTGLMYRGVYIREEASGLGDFRDSDTQVTMSASGRGKLCGCWKCRNCGWSVT